MSELISRDSLVEKIRLELSTIDLRQIKALEERDYITHLGAMTMYHAYYKALDLIRKEPTVEYERNKSDG